MHGLVPRIQVFAAGQDVDGRDIREDALRHGHDVDSASIRAEHALRRTSRLQSALPRYVEFDEYLGGYNFGGNCQLDFLNMQLDWACG
jgi:hypothetical protein